MSARLPEAYRNGTSEHLPEGVPPRYLVDMSLGIALERLDEKLRALERKESEARENVCIEVRSVLTTWMGLNRVRQDEEAARLVHTAFLRAEELLRGELDDCYALVRKRLSRFLALSADPRRLGLPMQLLEAIERLDQAIEAKEGVCEAAKMALDAWEANRRWCLGKAEAELLRDLILRAQPHFRDATQRLRDDVEASFEAILTEYGIGFFPARVG